MALGLAYQVMTWGACEIAVIVTAASRQILRFSLGLAQNVKRLGLDHGLYDHVMITACCITKGTDSLVDSGSGRSKSAEGVPSVWTAKDSFHLIQAIPSVQATTPSPVWSRMATPKQLHQLPAQAMCKALTQLLHRPLVRPQCWNTHHSAFGQYAVSSQGNSTSW